jgi:hypothetical protein
VEDVVGITLGTVIAFVCGDLTRVEAGSNTSTVNLRVVRGNEMGLRKAAPQLKRLVTGFPLLWSGVRDRVCHVGFCGGQSGAGVGFL